MPLPHERRLDFRNGDKYSRKAKGKPERLKEKDERGQKAQKKKNKNR
jgi:hypothetical protein